MAHPRTVVVGGTRGIGRAIAKLMANEGHDVMVAGRRPPDDDSLAYVMLDITDSDQVSECLSSLADAEVPLTNVVLAHRYRGQEEPWHAEIETTLTGTRTFVECFAAMAPDLPGRSVVVVSSVDAVSN